MRLTLRIPELPAFPFVFAIGLGVRAVAVICIIDVPQTRRAVRDNFPLVGCLRDLFKHPGGFFRQYFFARDRVEMPSKRADRSRV